LRAFLTNPHAVKPGTTMPDLFHASASLPHQAAVDFLVHFLVSQGGPIADPVGSGTQPLIDSGRNLYHSVGCTACHASEKGADPKSFTPSSPPPRESSKTPPSTSPAARRKTTSASASPPPSGFPATANTPSASRATTARSSGSTAKKPSPTTAATPPTRKNPA